MKKKTILSRLNINDEKVKRTFRQLLSPVFLLILLGSCVLWYASKLGHDYTTEMPLDVRIDGQPYSVTALVAGRGSIIVAQRMGLKAKLNLTLDELSTRRSRETEGAFTITPASLTRAINNKIKELEVKEVLEAPDFTPAPEGETAKERRQRKREEAKAKEAEEEAAREAEKAKRKAAEK